MAESCSDYDDMMLSEFDLDTVRNEVEEHSKEKNEKKKFFKLKKIEAILVIMVSAILYLLIIVAWNAILLLNGVIVFEILRKISGNLGVSIYITVFLELLIMDVLFQNFGKLGTKQSSVFLRISVILGQYNFVKWCQLILTIVITTINLVDIKIITANTYWSTFTEAFFPGVLSALLFEMEMVKPFTEKIKKKRKEKEEELKTAENESITNAFVDTHIIGMKAEEEYQNGYLDVLSHHWDGCTVSEVKNYNQFVYEYIKITYKDYFGANPRRKEHEITLTDLYVWKERKLFGAVGTRSVYKIPKEKSKQ
ncbi:MAG: hypothetical protein E7299_05400 [Lachnospiraceae bacterium]|nr:hypothetical protein [Lachnospiraceae bacterium]